MAAAPGHGLLRGGAGSARRRLAHGGSGPHLINVEEPGYISALEAWDEGQPIDPGWLVRPANPLSDLISHLEKKAGRPLFSSLDDEEE
jgi:hypothetical protein